MKKQFEILIGVLLLISISFMGCKSKEKLAKEKSVVSSTSLVHSIRVAEPAYETLEIKRLQLALHVNAKQKFKSSANAKMIRDSVIYISVQPFLGIEVFSIRLTPKHIYAIDKLKGIYYQADYTLFQEEFGFNIDFQAFQSVLSNQLFAVGYDSKTNMEKVFKKVDNKTIESNYQSLKQQVVVDENFRIKKVLVQANPSKEEFSVLYSGAVATSQVSFPSQVSFQFQSKTELLQFELAVDRVVLNEKLNIQDMNYLQYRKGDLHSLLDL